MHSSNRRLQVSSLTRGSYERAKREVQYIGLHLDKRRESTLDEARAELSEEFSKVAVLLFRDKYGPLLGAVSQPAINEFLKSLESNLSRTKGDLTLVFEELFERVATKNLRRRN